MGRDSVIFPAKGASATCDESYHPSYTLTERGKSYEHNRDELCQSLACILGQRIYLKELSHAFLTSKVVMMYSLEAKCLAIERARGTFQTQQVAATSPNQPGGGCTGQVPFIPNSLNIDQA